jgi:hypothetical protein
MSRYHDSVVAAIVIRSTPPLSRNGPLSPAHGRNAQRCEVYETPGFTSETDILAHVVQTKLRPGSTASCANRRLRSDSWCTVRPTISFLRLRQSETPLHKPVVDNSRPPQVPTKRPSRGTSTFASGLPHPVTGSQPGDARYPLIVFEGNVTVLVPLVMSWNAL